MIIMEILVNKLRSKFNSVSHRYTGWGLSQWVRYFKGKTTDWFMCSKCCKPHWEGEECTNPNCDDGWLS